MEKLLVVDNEDNDVSLIKGQADKIDALLNRETLTALFKDDGSDIYNLCNKYQVTLFGICNYGKSLETAKIPALFSEYDGLSDDERVALSSLPIIVLNGNSYFLKHIHQDHIFWQKPWSVIEYHDGAYRTLLADDDLSMQLDNLTANQVVLFNQSDKVASCIINGQDIALATYGNPKSYFVADIKTMKIKDDTDYFQFRILDNQHHASSYGLSSFGRSDSTIIFKDNRPQKVNFVDAINHFVRFDDIEDTNYYDDSNSNNTYCMATELYRFNHYGDNYLSQVKDSIKAVDIADCQCSFQLSLKATNYAKRDAWIIAPTIEISVNAPIQGITDTINNALNNLKFKTDISNGKISIELSKIKVVHPGKMTYMAEETYIVIDKDKFKEQIHPIIKEANQVRQQIVDILTSMKSQINERHQIIDEIHKTYDAMQKYIQAITVLKGATLTDKLYQNLKECYDSELTKLISLNQKIDNDFADEEIQKLHQAPYNAKLGSSDFNF